MGKVSNVIEMRPRKQEVMYLYGATIRQLEARNGGNPESLFDLDGTPVLSDELYEVTSAGIKRV